VKAAFETKIRSKMVSTSSFLAYSTNHHADTSIPYDSNPQMKVFELFAWCLRAQQFFSISAADHW
jgi:hypothetical protein